MVDGKWGPGRLWVDVEIGSRRVSIFNDYPGHFYALDAGGVVRSATTLEEMVARLKSHPG